MHRDPVTLLEHLRRSPRWVILLVGIAALAVTTAALIPHNDNGEDLDCLVCKAGHAPFTELTVVLVAEPPLEISSFQPERRAQIARALARDTASPRAPPI